MERMGFKVQENIILNTVYLTAKFNKNKTYEGSQGKCCCCFSNKRGVRMILWFDMLNFFLFYRSVLAFACLYGGYTRFYQCYNRIRTVSFVIQVVGMLVGLFTWIVIDVIHYTNEYWLE